MRHKFITGLASATLLGLSLIALCLFFRFELATLLLIAAMCAAIAGKVYEPR